MQKGFIKVEVTRLPFMLLVAEVATMQVNDLTDCVGKLDVTLERDMRRAILAGNERVDDLFLPVGHSYH